LINFDEFFFCFLFLQFVFVSLAGWGALFYSGYKYFTSGSTTPKSAKEEEEATASKRDHHADPKTEKGKH
jgi:threonine/homoserine/homoserine lactone efflux protein